MIHVLLGTRAQVIKMAPVMHLLQQRGVDYNFIFMAQHRATIYEMLDEFDLKHPDHVLGDIGADIVSSRSMARWSLSVLASGIRHGARVFRGDRQGVVLLHGDAPPLLLGAILAKIRGLRVAAVEAGLRSDNLFRPFPEELVRRATGRLGLIDVHFCQDEAAVRNAARFPGRAIDTGGNSILDALRLAATINRGDGRPAGYLGRERYAVVTLHRYETIARREQLARAVDHVLRISRSIPVRFILHPPTRRALQKFGLDTRLAAAPNVELLPRLSFVAFQSLIASTEFLVTDGGSNQEESYYLGIPCLLFRSETERTEGLGRNVVLSAFEPGVIDDFVANHARYRFPPVTPSISPARVVVDHIVELAGPRRDSPVAGSKSENG